MAVGSATVYTRVATVSDEDDETHPLTSPHPSSWDPSPPSSPSRTRLIVSLLTLLLLIALFTLTAPTLLAWTSDVTGPNGPHLIPHRSGASLDPSTSSAPLSAAEREVIELLTGSREPTLHIPPSLLSLLRLALQRLAETVLRLRPALQRELWKGDCRIHFPCPFPTADLRAQVTTSPFPDSAVHSALLSRPPALTQWLLSWNASHSPDALFHSPPTLSSSLTSAPLSHSHFAPGEPASSQSLAQSFQSALYALQHPVNCSAASFLVLDYWHTGGGFGSWNHVRSIPLALAFRANRTLVEAPIQWADRWAYVMAWNDCVRRQGMGGCGLFLPPTSCPLPEDWRRTWEEGIKALALSAGPPPDAVDAHLAWLQPLSIIPYSELKAGMGDELHHDGPSKGWDRATMAALTADRLQPFRVMPECWWMRQALAYNQRMTGDGMERVARLLARTLQLPQPALAAGLARKYAERRATVGGEGTDHWWLLAQAIKVTWQLHIIAPDLAPALRQQLPPVKPEPGRPSPSRPSRRRATPV